MSKPLIVFHKGCADGAGAAYAAWLRFGEDAEYRASQYGDEPPTVEEILNREIFVLDFSYKREQLLELVNWASHVTLLDHHKSAEEELRGLGGPKLEIIFDMKRSGARIAHDHFAASYRERVDDLINYIQDRDLWTWALPDSREVSAALQSHGITKDFRILDRLNVEDLKREGKAILRYQDDLVKSLCRNAREIELDGHKVLGTNAPVLQSEVAGELAAGRPFGIAWFWSAKGEIVVSLRVRDGECDVSQIAKKFGGGGHAKAAGFSYQDDLVMPWSVPVDRSAK